MSCFCFTVRIFHGFRKFTDPIAASTSWWYWYIEIYMTSPTIHTVAGRNPAPVDMVNIPLFAGFCTSQVVSQISSINSIGRAKEVRFHQRWCNSPWEGWSPIQSNRRNLRQCRPGTAEMAGCFLVGLSNCLAGGFKYFLMLTPTWGNDPIWRAYFSNGWFNHQVVVFNCMHLIFGLHTSCLLLYFLDSYFKGWYL